MLVFVLLQHSTLVSVGTVCEVPTESLQYSGSSGSLAKP